MSRQRCKRAWLSLLIEGTGLDEGVAAHFDHKWRREDPSESGSCLRLFVGLLGLLARNKWNTEWFIGCTIKQMYSHPCAQTTHIASVPLLARVCS